ncbi:ER-derived vesicles protein erv46 [Thecaphora frezii]
MGKNGLFGQLRGIDAFSKTMDDVRVRTNVGALITLISTVLIVVLTIGEFVDYRTVHLKPSLEVDRSRGEKLTVNMNITFPRVPCYLVSLDVMDISGEHQSDIKHDIERIRVNADGVPVESGTKKGLTGDAARIAKTRGKDYCGSCYGGISPANGCCNTCDEVREAYVRKGWSFSDPDHVDQCVEEGWTQKIKEQNREGCRLSGKLHVNKVVGSFHLSPGRAFQSNSMHVHDLVPYLTGTGAEHHDFGHFIHAFGFASENESGTSGVSGRTVDDADIKRRLGVKDPLEGVRAHTEHSQFMFQYFLKVVATEFRSLAGETLKTHQYSVTTYERDLSPGASAKLAAGHSSEGSGAHVMHGFAGVPGVFFNYEISPIKTIHTETRQRLSHFLTSTCAIVGGILTVAGLVDSAIYNYRRRLGATSAESADLHAREGLGYTSKTGKFL